MITGIAIIISLVLLVAKLLADSSESESVVRIGGFLIWLIIPLLMLFIINAAVRVSNIVPELPLFF